ncbi:MAG: hypothetical protein JWO48_2120 [Bryobacterales bacterium]|nr:hypothetical protein [Bryobacterales bacterium]
MIEVRWARFRGKPGFDMDRLGRAVEPEPNRGGRDRFLTAA